MKSMTGFGSGTASDESAGIGFKAEISSINKKQFELKLGLARELAQYEIPIRNFVSEKLARGSVSLRIDFLPGRSPVPKDADFSRLRAVYDAALRFQKENAIPGEISISDLLALPDAMPVFTPDYSAPIYFNLMKQAVGEALDRLLEMRLHEGELLKEDLLRRIAAMEKMTDFIRPFAEKLPGLQKEKLLAKLRELLPGTDPGDERLLKEAVIYGDKLDVTEELTRLACHFEHFRKLADSKEAVGRSLDFLVQEIFRECTTLGNKAASTEISPKIVELKTELEKIREQVQNIE